MCGRYSQTQSAEKIAEVFQLKAIPELSPRYNIAPTQNVSTVLVTSEQPSRQHRLLRWGLIPSWAKDKTIGSRLINARAETIAEKPSFRAAFKRRRALIIADGFYEWRRTEASKQKQPFYFQLRDRSSTDGAVRAPFAFAGLWEHWQDAAGEIINSCTILTTEANELLRPIHHRMPVILNPADYDLWLDPTVQEASALQPLLQPYAAAKMMAYPVSTQVNSPKNDYPDCIEPVEA